MDLGSHMVDLLQYFLGPMKSVAGFSSNQLKLYEAEDVVSSSFVFECGAQGAGIWNFGAGENTEVTEIVGSAGKISYSVFQDQPVVFEQNGKSEKLIIPHPEHVQQPLIQCVVDELLGVGKSPSTGRSGAHTSWVLDNMLGRS
jgi:predicted dehydrogenase